MANSHYSSGLGFIHVSQHQASVSSGSSSPNSHSSTPVGDVRPYGGEHCSVGAKVPRLDSQKLMSRLRAKEASLRHKSHRLEQKEAIIKELRRDIRRLSNTVVLLRRDVDFWKLGCSHGEVWRDRYAMLEDTILPKPANPLAMNMDTGGANIPLN